MNTTSPAPSTPIYRHPRACQVAALAALRAPGATLAGVSQLHDVPTSTLCDWATRCQQTSLRLGPQVSAFFESPAGLAFLRRLVVAAVFCMSFLGDQGCRRVSRFLELLGLDALIASSHSTIARITRCLELETVTWADEQLDALAEGVELQPCTLLCDETFHRGEVCLVAIEASSGFILSERYSADRKLSSWLDAVQRPLERARLDPVLVSTDGARALIALTEELGADRLPDLFHVRRDLSRLLRRAREIADVDEDDDEVIAARAHVSMIADALQITSIETGRAWSVDARREFVMEHLEALRSSSLLAVLEGGDVTRLGNLLEDLETLLNSLTGWSELCDELFTARALDEASQRLIREQIMPRLDLERRLTRARRSEERELVLMTQEKLERHEMRDPIAAPTPRRELEAIGAQLVGLFHRGNSAVEGRNAMLRRSFELKRGLSQRRLSTLTAVHNFAQRRRDGTTAAERLFGRKHDDLFEYLVEALPELSRPGRRRGLA